MTLEQIKTQPDPYEPLLLSQGIRVGEFLFISGQAGYADDGRIVEGGFRAQGEQAFSNLERALVAGGASLENVVKVTIFVTDMGNFSEIVELRRKYFSAPYPADSIVEVSGLYAGRRCATAGRSIGPTSTSQPVPEAGPLRHRAGSIRKKDRPDGI